MKTGRLHWTECSLALAQMPMRSGSGGASTGTNPFSSADEDAPNRGLHPQIKTALYRSPNPDDTVPAGLCFKMTRAIRTCLNEGETPLFRLLIPKTEIVIGLRLKELHVHLLGSGRGFFVPALTAETENICLLAAARHKAIAYRQSAWGLPLGGWSYSQAWQA